jgi:methylglutaconyl-CoA hydratase
MNQPLEIVRDARGVVTLWLARPEVHNALDEPLIAALTATLADLAADASVRVLVIAARGRSFCAGADLGWMQRAATASSDENLRDAERLAELFERLDGFPRATVATIQGAAFGGGVGLVASCDIAIATERASFALSEVRLGLVPGVISPYVVAAIGIRAARWLAVSGTRIDAASALRLGLLQRVVADEAALTHAVNETVDELLAGAPEAQAASKRLLAAVAANPSGPVRRALTTVAIAEARASQAGREGVSAFLAKRAPEWRNAIPSELPHGTQSSSGRVE